MKKKYKVTFLLDKTNLKDTKKVKNKNLKNKCPNVVAIHSNTSVAMINKHCQALSDNNLVIIHNQLFPERTTSIKNKVLKKK